MRVVVLPVAGLLLMIACSPAASPADSSQSAPSAAAASPTAGASSAAAWEECESLTSEDLSSPDPVGVTSSGPLELVQEVALAGEPVFLAYGAGAVWASGAAGELWRIDDSREATVSEVEAGATGPAWLAFAHDSLWFARMTDGVLVRYDPATESVVAEIQLEVSDRPMAIAADATSVWVANQLAGTVSQVDIATETVNQTIDLHDGGPADPGPSGVAVLGDQLWVSEHRADSVARIDLTTGEITRRCLGTPDPGRIAATSTDVWIAEIGGLLTQVDPTTAEVVARIEVPGRVFGEIAVGDDGLWMGNNSHVVLYDPAGGTVASVELAEETTDRQFPAGLAIAVGSGAAWTSNPAAFGLQRIEARP
jgi:streptogramin lyase